MALLDPSGRLFGKLNLLDAAIAAAIVVGGLGLVAVKTGHTAMSAVVQAEGPAEIDLLIRASLKDLGAFRAGDKAFVTIRNQPYDKVEIVKVDAHRAPIAVPINDGRDFRVTTDPSSPFASEVVLTLRDKGQRTEDGIVWGGQKLKIGVPIDVEGFKYRLRGSVLDVRMVSETAK